MNLSTFSKAVAGGLVSAVVAVLARYGFHANGQEIAWLGVVITALSGYVIGHLVVYLAPANKVVAEIEKDVEDSTLSPATKIIVKAAADLIDPEGI